jgi:FMN-dependent NADH-azoreductase
VHFRKVYPERHCEQRIRLMTILHVTSSTNPAASKSTLLGTEVVAKLGSTATTRDTSTIPAIDADWVAANFTPADQRSAQQTKAMALSDTLVDELKAADTVVISVAMYNFSIPATLKSWIDQICRAGITFKYSAAGPEGLLAGKRAILVVATGGTPVGSTMDYATHYLRHILGFVGITNVQIVAVDRLAEEADKALADARQAITAL